MSRWSIRWQLTVCYALALSVVMLAFSAVMYATIRSYLLARIDAELAEESNELAEEIELTKSEQEFRERFQERESEHALFGFEIAEMDGTIRIASPWLKSITLPRPLSPDDRGFQTLQNIVLPDGQPARYFGRVLALPEGPVVIYIAAPLEQFESQLRNLFSMLAINGIVALLLAVVIGYLIARQVLVPILNMTATAERISSENLSERVQTPNRSDELGRLATTLNRTFDRLQRSIHEMRRFTADAAHELRTPLAVIRTESEVALRSQEQQSEFQQNAFRRVAEVSLAESTRLSNLVDQLLMLSRQEAGLQPPRHEEVSLRALLLDVIETLRVVAETKAQKLVVTDLTERPVLGDDISLSQLFFNLIDNAVKYTPVGGTITISSRSHEPNVIVTIEDTGIGIEHQHLDHLFERFYRVEASRSSDGTGLGLAICRSIVDAHHGQLQVESEPGHGSRFTVTLQEMSHPSAS